MAPHLSPPLSPSLSPYSLYPSSPTDRPPSKMDAHLNKDRSFSDLVLDFLEEEEEEKEVMVAEVEREDHGSSPDVDKCFWEEQHHLLQEALSVSSGVEARIARKIESLSAVACSCSRNAGVECRSCKLRAISRHLQDLGYDCAMCVSKWRNSMRIPSGEHRYLDVLYKSNTGKKRMVRILIELTFRAEFVVARANHEYETLVGRLPEVFVGRPEKLRTAIKVMCTAAKKCMKDNGLHMGPWRKHKYMQAKWLSAPAERVTTKDDMDKSVAGGGWFADEERPSPRLQRSSMLTSDLLEKLPAAEMRCTAVKVQ